MNFSSDNVTGVAPEIMAALAVANARTAASYGADAITERLTRRFSEVFERQVAVFPVATGTAANALALATLTPPWGVVYGHRDAHFQVDECGAPEFYTGGAKLRPLDGAHGKITAADLDAAIMGRGVVHHAQPAAVSLTQSTEAGTVYRADEIRQLADIAHARGNILLTALKTNALWAEINFVEALCVQDAKTLGKLPNNLQRLFYGRCFAL